MVVTYAKERWLPVAGWERYYDIGSVVRQESYRDVA